MSDEPRPRCPIGNNGAGHPHHDWTVCATHIQAVDHQLADLLDLVALANSTAALLPATSGTGIGSPRREPPVPVDLAALDLAVGESVLAVLEQWERWWRETLADGLASYGEASASRLIVHVSHGSAELDATPTHRNLSGTVAFLRAWWPRAATVTEPPPEEFAAEVRTLHRRAETALRLNPDPGWTMTCPTDGCAARLRVTHDGREALVRCLRCGATRTLHQLLLLARDAGRPCWVDADTAARHLGISVQHLGPLARDGRLRVRGHGDCRQFDINSLRHAGSAG